jgi:hypothetical protein
VVFLISTINYLAMSTLGSASGYYTAANGADAVSGDVCIDGFLDIDLSSMISGRNIGNVRIEAHALGRELVSRVRDALGQPRGIITLAFGAISVIEDRPVGQQSWCGTGPCLVLNAPITEAEERAIVEARILGQPSMVQNEWQLWDGVNSIIFPDHFNQDLETMMLPSGLQSITFNFEFNQSMENVTLPNGLQNITYGGWFNQSMENVTLPSGLQSITFGGSFNQSMVNVSLPGGCTVHRI